MPASADSVVVSEPIDGVALVTLNRPRKHNAIDQSTAEALLELANAISLDSSIQVVVLNGAGRSFCAGSDINDVATADRGEAYRIRDIRPHSYPLFAPKLLQPVIAVVHGYCLGGGFELAINSDLRIASTDALFGTPEVNLGWLGGGGTTQLLPRLIGPHRALELLMTGDRISAQTAWEWGLLNRLVEPDVLMEEAMELAEIFTSKPSMVLQAAKKGIRYGMNVGLDIGMLVERELSAISIGSDNANRGIEEFKRRSQEPSS